MPFHQTIVQGPIRRIETKSFGQNKSVCNFSIPISKKWTDKSTGEKREKTQWYNCAAFDGTGEIIAKYHTVGSEILVVGEMNTDTYTNKEGVQVQGHTLEVKTFNFVNGQSTESTSPPAQASADFEQDTPF